MRRIVEVCVLGALALVGMSSSAMPLGARILLHGHAVARQLAEIEPPPELPAGGSTDTVVDVGGKSVTVPGTWIAEHSALIEAAGGDTAAALKTPSANGRLSIADCYVVGLDPEIATNDFRIMSFPMKADGTPDIEHIVFDPPQAKWNVPATYRVKGAANLDDVDWPEVTEGNKANFRFFRVELVLP